MTPVQELWLRTYFPRLVDSDFSFESPQTFDYNCFAWALGHQDRRYDPTGGFWPPELERKLNLQTFIALFELDGYAVSETGELEEGFEKIAIFYGRDQLGGIGPTHAARQLANGRWTSKLGDYEDVEHADVASVGGIPGYGEIRVFMRRARQGWTSDGQGNEEEA